MALTADTLRFLAGLERNNTRDWFEPRKDEYIRFVRNPMLELVAALNGHVSRFAPGYVTLPEKAIFRIYRDTRFSKDKRPYKTNAGALFWHRAVPKNSGAAFYVSVSAREAMIAGGLYRPGAAETLAIRKHIAERHGELRALLRARGLRGRFGDLQGDSLARAPKGFAPEHPAIDLLRRRDWVLWVTEAPQTCLDAKFPKRVADGFRLLAPLVAFLNEPLIAQATRPRDPLAARVRSGRS
ncbi:MAG TPA: DUF2461 domain-containing protein [Bryobacteraceae bacterium]|nr:DUF2461 domain-containing protein [Bryobacteraceae bacterium]